MLLTVTLTAPMTTAGAVVDLSSLCLILAYAVTEWILVVPYNLGVDHAVLVPLSKLQIGMLRLACQIWLRLMTSHLLPLLPCCRHVVQSRRMLLGQGRHRFQLALPLLPPHPLHFGNTAVHILNFSQLNPLAPELHLRISFPMNLIDPSELYCTRSPILYSRPRPPDLSYCGHYRLSINAYLNRLYIQDWSFNKQSPYSTNWCYFVIVQLAHAPAQTKSSVYYCEG